MKASTFFIIPFTNFWFYIFEFESGTVKSPGALKKCENLHSYKGHGENAKNTYELIIVIRPMVRLLKCS